MMTIKSFILIEEDHHYLLVRESGFQWRGKWFLPGGALEGNESPEAALRRETKEETGLRVEVKGLFYLRCMPRWLGSELHLFYTGRVVEGQLKTKSDKHSLEARWLSYEEAMQLPLRQHLVTVIEAYHKTKECIPTHNFVIMRK